MVIAKAEKYAHVVVRGETVESFGPRSSRSGQPANQDEDEVNQHGTTE
jgi:hypothetical protein